MKTITIEDWKRCIKAQNVPNLEIKFICPRCKHVQSAQDLINAGAGKDFEEVEKYLGFSCIGRWNEIYGCNWTLGGLFSIHTLEIVTEDGIHHPTFEPINLEEFLNAGA